MMNYTKYFIINLVIEGFFSWLPEKKQISRLSYVVLEVKEDVFDGNYCYTYTGFCFEGTLIKKLLSTKSVDRLIASSTSRSHINFSRCVPKSLTNEEILSIIHIHSLIPTSIRSKIYSYSI